MSGVAVRESGHITIEETAGPLGLGPLQPYLDDPTVEEVWINEPGRVFVARGGVSELTTTILGDEQVRDLVERMLMTSGRRLDLSQPFVDASLPDGSRLHVVIPDVTRRHWAVRHARLSGTNERCAFRQPQRPMRTGTSV